MTREEAIEYLHKLFMQADITDAYGDMDNTEPYEIAMDMAVEALSDVPDTNVGKWIPHSEFQEYDVCSACGLGCKRREYGVTDGNEWMSEWNYRFCPNCGAKMEAQNDKQHHRAFTG